MPSNLTGLNSVDRAVPPAAGSVGRGEAAPSYALTRIAPVEPGATPGAVPGSSPASPPAGSPLGRSGLDLLDLLSTTDLVAARAPTGAVAMEVGLESARNWLLRNLPGDALAALDGVWERARRTEEGWYLRSGALTVLGLPGECDRVAEAGLGVHPNSAALRFVQSLARVAVGDLAGARAVLQPALARVPGSPALQIQAALIGARQGDAATAKALLDKFEQQWPEHQAVVWGRSALRAIVADATRQPPRATAARQNTARQTPVDWPAADAAGTVRAGGRTLTPAWMDVFGGATAGDVDAATRARANSTNASPTQASPTELAASASALGVGASDAAAQNSATHDVAAAALERFGARVAVGSANDIARDARMLLRAFSAGGTLSAATSAEQAHAARVVLTAFLSVASGERAEVPTTVRTLVEQLIPLMQEQRVADAERLMRRQSALAREPIGRLILSVSRGASPELDAMLPRAGAPGLSSADAIASGGAKSGAASPNGANANANATVNTTSNTPSNAGATIAAAYARADGFVIRGDADRGPVVPVRIGLSLLEETSAQRAAMGNSTPRSVNVLSPTNGAERGLVLTPRGALASDPLFGDVPPGPMSVPDAESSLSGWGAARAAAEVLPAPSHDAGTGIRVAALLCVAVAGGALVTGHGAIALGLAAGAVWLGLRRSGGSAASERDDRSDVATGRRVETPHDGSRSQ